MRRAALALLLLPTLACGGAPFIAGELAASDDGGELDAATPATDAGIQVEASAPEASSMLDAGMRSSDADRPIDSGDAVDSGRPTTDDAGNPAPDDAGSEAMPDASPPPVEAGPAPDPVTYACGSKSGDGTTPAPSALQWWASVSVSQVDGSVSEDYCTSMSLGNSQTFPYTCAGIASVWDCTHWQGGGTTVGCHPNTLNPAILQVDCVAP